jgi:23S rRNA pseudouridine1911/1915/1917 synthase
LDKDTSGVILFAKNERAHRDLQDQFKARSVEKKYLALVDGHPPTPEGIVNAPIGRDVRHRKRMAVVADGSGRDAVTIFRTRERFIEHTLLGLEPKTGRTHQVRVHLAYVGCPIVGDRVYGHRRPSLPIERQFLHAMQLTIRLPGGADVRTFTAPVPADLEALLAQLHGNEVEN